MNTHNCPYCGAAIQAEEARHDIWQCRHCSHSLLLEAQPVVQPIQSTLDNNALITLGASFTWRGQRYTTTGYYCFAHTDGLRAEWQLEQDNGDHAYLIADDENLFLLRPLAAQDEEVPSWEALQPNTQLRYADKDWLVTEQRVMTLDSASENIANQQNSKRQDCYLTADNAETLQIIFTSDTTLLRRGCWLDPFEIEVSA